MKTNFRHFTFSLVVLCGLVDFHCICAFSENPAPQSVKIVVSSAAAPQIGFGAREIRASLEGLGNRVQIGTSSSSKYLTIRLGLKGEDVLGYGADRLNVPAAPESFTLATPSKNTIVVAGSDATGAMYGAFELAEQIASASSSEFVSQLRPVSKSPFLPLRGVNDFICVQDIDQANGAFWSDDYWSGFLDLMARNRYNLLDIHGPLDDVTLRFPNGFSYFISLPNFPQVGVGPERAHKNIERFRRIIQMAADRGIKVAYMNYEAPAPIGAWKTRTFGKDERWTPIDQDFLNGPQLEDYTREAVESFLKQLPELWMFGFRVGESGQPEDFYKKTYLAALKDAPKDLNIYVRTWVADPAKVRELAASTPHKLYIEPKYNGEQLGSPYQAVLGGRDYAASGSYENYTSYPKNFSILWQIRAHGTHRVFFWGNPEFARRTVRSCKFGDGVGFSMEPMDAYNPTYDYLHNNPKVGHNFYKWMYQREWLWHMIWGRTAYDPDVPEQVFRAEFVRRFGAEAGPKTYESIVEASKIVPFIYSYHTAGLDHQEFAPELENGDHALYGEYPGAWVQRWTGDRLIPLSGDNKQFLSIQPIDRTAMADPMTYVDFRLQYKPTGKLTPFEAADYLDAAANAAEAAMRKAEAQKNNNPEFDCMQRDVEALTALGRYYADRIRSATHLAFYERTRDHAEVQAAYRDLRQAIDHWDHLAEVADAHFGFVPDLIRMGVNRFQWKDESRTLEVDLNQIDKLELEYANFPDSPAYHPAIGHVPPFKLRPGKPFVVNASITGLSVRRRPNGLSIFYRNSHQHGFTEAPMHLSNAFVDTWTATIPAEALVAGRLEYYFEVEPLKWNQSDLSVDGQSPYVVFVNNDDEKPSISHQESRKGIRGNNVPLEIEVQSAAPVQSACVYYKLMPAHHQWVRMDMENLGKGRFRAQVPLTPEGMLYYFEVIDEDGNSANYPNFLERTPYFVVDSWDDTASARADTR